MDKRGQHHRPRIKTVSLLLIRIIVYAGFVTAYYFLVLLFSRDWLKHMFDAHKAVYATTALLLIVGQAALLDFVITCLRKLGGRKVK
jgi:hypothetical protein